MRFKIFCFLPLKSKSFPHVAYFLVLTKPHIIHELQSTNTHYTVSTMYLQDKLYSLAMLNNNPLKQNIYLFSTWKMLFLPLLAFSSIHQKLRFNLSESKTKIKQTMNVLFFFFISDETNKSKTFFPIFLHRRRKKRKINASCCKLIWFPIGGFFFTFLMKRRFAWNDYFSLWLIRPQGLRNIIDTVFIG